MLNRVSKTAAGEDQKDFMDIENLITREQINSTFIIKGKTSRYHVDLRAGNQNGRKEGSWNSSVKEK